VNVADEYRVHVVGNRPSCALALLAVWDAPWSGRAMKFAYHALHHAVARGLDVLEYPVARSWSDCAK